MSPPKWHGQPQRATYRAWSVTGTAVKVSAIGPPVWTTLPTLVYVEGDALDKNLGMHVSGYNALTDVFVTVGNPAWLGLTTVGGNILRANGTQVDGDDTTVNIGVSRSGGAYVYTGLLTVTVNPAPVATGSIDDLAYEGPVSSSVSATGKHANIQFCPLDGAFYIHGGDGSMAIPGGTTDSGAIHSVRWTLNGARTNITEDLYYPYWGISGEIIPGGAGCNSWIWDNSRSCFWSAGGFFEGQGIFLSDPRRIGDCPTTSSEISRIWRFDLTGAFANKWRAITGPSTALHGEGHGAVLVPPLDTIFAFTGDTSRRFSWYNCATGATGQMTLGLTTGDSPYSGPFPGVVPDNANDGLNEDPLIYDSVNNEIIWQCHDTNYKGIYATSLANFPGNLTTRQLWRGFENGGTASGYAQKPFWIRNRKLYSLCVSYGASTHDGVNPSGNGLGFYELDLESLEMQQGSPPIFELEDTTNTISPGAPLSIGYVNEGGYSPVDDLVLVTHRYINNEPLRVGTKPLIFKFSPPSWTPAEGQVKAITLDSVGTATNTMQSMWAAGGPHTAVSGPASAISAWGSAVYARNLSTNGVMLVWNGGDQDYWGNEVYGFDFDIRRWIRLTEPITIGGDPTGDRLRSTSDPLYFNNGELEHGPQVGDGQCSNGDWGLLPAGTEPGVPHNYSGLNYIPGNFVGNRRGALVSAFQTTTYTTSSSMRAHYLDLDEVAKGSARKWGRLSTNKFSFGSTTTTVCVFDEEAGRIYHNWGYLNLNTKANVVTGGGGTVGGDFFGLNAHGFHLASTFDPERRLILQVLASGVRIVSVGPAGSAPTAVIGSMQFTGDALWVSDQAEYGGIEYCPTLDCVFFYNQGFVGRTLTPQVIWKLTPSAGNTFGNPWTVSRITMPTAAQGGVDIVNNTNVHGTYGRLRWIPPLKCLAFVNSWNGSMYLYKPVGV